MHFDSDRFIHSRCRHCEEIYEPIQAMAGLQALFTLVSIFMISPLFCWTEFKCIKVLKQRVVLKMEHLLHHVPFFWAVLSSIQKETALLTAQDLY